MALTTLGDIRTKIRRLTRSPSEAQLTTAQIDEYVNTFLLYDLPDHLRLFQQQKTFTFYTQPNVDVYATNTTDTTSPLYDFKNKYISVNPPVYIAGYSSLYSQSREQFFNIYPQLRYIASIGFAGDGVTTTFTGTLSQTPVLRNQVLFDSIDTVGGALALVDVPIDNVSGSLVVPNDNVVYGLINYVTGQFNFTFPSAPGSGQPINSQTVPYVANLPQAILFFDDAFTLRPVPDQTYPVNMEVFVRPTELISSIQTPELNQWSQYIAYGAARKVFQDRMDMESIAMVEPEYRIQERLVLRRTLVQLATQRTPTIYTEQLGGLGGIGNGFGWGGGSF